MNKKGFTLIELLAVVVVLGIIMVLSVTTVLPYMENARKEAFATEAEVFKKSAEQAINLINVGVVKGDYTKGTGDYCFTISDLKTLGIFNKDDSSYNGVVVVNKNLNYYQYIVKLHNKEYYILQTNAKNVETDDILVLTEEIKNNSADLFTCYPEGENAYAIYSDTDKSLTFVKSAIPIQQGDIYSGKIVTNVYADFEDTELQLSLNVPWGAHRNTLKKVVFESEIKPISTAWWFSFFTKLEYLDVSRLNTARVTNMEGMFYEAASNSSGWSIIGLDNWDVSNVTNMAKMFSKVGLNSTNWSLSGLDGWNTSSVTDMSYMFYGSGTTTSNWNAGNLSGWNVSNVITMEGMFGFTGNKATNWSVGNISNWNVSKVNNMSSMFQNAGVGANYSLNLSGWNVSNVIQYNKFNEGVSTKVISPVFGSSS